MTEFAFSGVGINPHYGTPGNPFDRQRIPGGSSSGRAVSVADGCALVAIGTDTGGSVRIPAALCGVVGFKPTAKRVPREGRCRYRPRSNSIGPLANSVACCAIADAVHGRRGAGSAGAGCPSTGLRLGVPQSLVLDDLAPEVAGAFAVRAPRCPARALASSICRSTNLANTQRSATGGFSPARPMPGTSELMARRGNEYDPRVRSRIEFGRNVSAAAYIRLCAARADFVTRVASRTAEFDALLMPTVAIIAPPIAAFAEDREYFRLNFLILRNTSVINFLDRCAITLPIQPAGTAPVGLMVVGEHGGDRQLLAIASGIEAALARHE